MNFKKIKNFNELEFSINSYEALKKDWFLNTLLLKVKDNNNYNLLKDDLNIILGRIFYIQEKKCLHIKTKSNIKFSIFNPFRFKKIEKRCLLCDKKLK